MFFYKEKKRYNPVSLYWKQKFGKRVERISVDIGFGCPHRNNKRGKGGCIFCYNGSNYGNPIVTPDTIFEYISSFIERRDKKNKKLFIVYFQNYTSTYGDIKYLERAIYSSLKHKKIIGISISTRPDSFSEEVYRLLERLNQETYLIVESGLQTGSNEKLEFLNRGHTVEDFINSTELLKEMNIEVVAHIILGIPKETYQEIEYTISLLNKLSIDGVKFHHLHALKGTKLGILATKGEFKGIPLYSYIKRLTYAISLLKREIVIHRLIGDAPKDLLITPLWNLKKNEVLQLIDRYLERKDLWQGKYLKKAHI